MTSTSNKLPGGRVEPVANWDQEIEPSPRRSPTPPPPAWRDRTYWRWALAVLVVLMALYRYLPGPEVLLLPVFLALAVLAALGTGLYMAALNVKYRDFRYVVPIVVQFGLYVTPVAFGSADVYNNPSIPAALKFLYSCNPMVSVIDGFRFSLFGHEMPVHWPGFVVSLAVSLLLLLLGIRYFRRTEKGFADII